MKVKMIVLLSVIVLGIIATMPAAAEPWATRTLPTGCVEPGADFTVTIEANDYGGFGEVNETLCDGWVYQSVTGGVSEDQVQIDGNVISFLMMGPGLTTFTYTVQAPDTPGAYCDISGVLADDGQNKHTVTGPARVDVCNDDEPWATRTLPTGCVEPGADFTVTIEANDYGGFGEVNETLCDGWVYQSVTGGVSEDQVQIDGNVISFLMMGPGLTTFTYTVQAPDTPGAYCDISGVLADDGQNKHTVTGPARVDVCNDDEPWATRTLPTGCVEPGADFTVTIEANDYGGFGEVNETLCDGWVYQSVTGGVSEDQVQIDGNVISFLMMGPGLTTFTYTVQAPDTPGAYCDISGVLADDGQNKHTVTGPARVDVCNDDEPWATRTLPTGCVEPGADFTVTIEANDYGGFGEVNETLCDGWVYQSVTGGVSEDQVQIDGNVISFLMMGPGLTTFTYTVQAPDTPGAYCDISGVLADDGQNKHTVTGPARVDVCNDDEPWATRTLPTGCVEPGADFTVTIEANDYGGFGEVNETLCDGWVYQSVTGGVSEDQVQIDGNVISFLMMGPGLTTFTYTVQAPDTPGAYCDISGVLADDGQNKHTVTGPARVDVCNDDEPWATRTLPTGCVEPGADFTVTIEANDYGGFGEVNETLCDGWVYQSVTGGVSEDQVQIDGNVISFLMMGPGLTTFTYTVQAPDTPGAYCDISGVLADDGQNKHTVTGPARVDVCNDDEPWATRTLPTGCVEPGADFTVTIEANDYGGFGEVNETLCDGWVYQSVTGGVSEDQVQIDGNVISFLMMGPGLTTFTYTVQAPDTPGAYCDISGVLADDGQNKHTVTGPARVDVCNDDEPWATRTLPTGCVEPGADFTVTIEANDYGGFGEVNETLCDGWVYQSVTGGVSEDQVQIDGNVISFLMMGPGLTTFTYTVQAPDTPGAYCDISGVLADDGQNKHTVTGPARVDVCNDDEPWATRTLPTGCVEPGADFTVTIEANDYGGFGEVNETLCDGWVYQSVTGGVSEDQVQIDGNVISFLMMGPGLTTFTYTVQAPDTPGAYCDISGVLADDGQNKHTVTGPARVDVCNDDEPWATRTLPTGCVEPGADFTVTIEANDYGGFGEVNETLCDGWVYQSVTGGVSEDQVQIDGNVISFLMMGPGLTTFTYTVQAPDTPGAYCDISGVLADDGQNKHTVTGPARVDVCNDDEPWATRTLPTGCVEPGADFTVTIEANDYGGFGEVNETLCDGWVYQSVTGGVSEDQVQIDGNVISFLMMGPGLTTFTYTVQAPDTPGAYCDISGVLADDGQNKHTVTGPARVDVCNDDDWWLEWMGPDSDGGSAVTTLEVQDAVYRWANDLLVRGYLMSTPDIQWIVAEWASG